MNCPSCHIEVSKLIAVGPLDEKINKFGRKEVFFEAHHQQWIEWENDHYHCNNCGATFTFAEGTAQAFRDPKPVEHQVKLDRLIQTGEQK
jgi:hypothetical protein